MHGLLGRLPKPVRFGLAGAIGCLWMSVVAERLIPWEEDWSKTQDLVYLSLDIGLLAVGVVLALLVAQNLYLRRPLLTPRQGLLCSVGAFAGGVLAGLAAEMVWRALEGSHLARVGCWGTYGAVMGFAVAFVVPNLGKLKGALGGALGGAIGALWFDATAGRLGDSAGRLAGDFVLGFCIGLMIALIERLSRGAQLVVHWAPGQESLIALGPQPIAIGTAPDAHVRLPRESGLPAVAATVALVDGRIEHEDRVTGRRTGLEDGSRFELGGTAMEVKAGR